MCGTGYSCKYALLSPVHAPPVWNKTIKVLASCLMMMDILRSDSRRWIVFLCSHFDLNISSSPISTNKWREESFLYDYCTSLACNSVRFRALLLSNISDICREMDREAKCYNNGGGCERGSVTRPAVACWWRGRGAPWWLGLESQELLQMGGGRRI